jgi:hypothetical protein
MKKFGLFLFLLSLSSSSFSSSPTEEIESLCQFHKEYASNFNPDRLSRIFGASSYPGEKKFQDCVERGLDSYNDGMLAVFKNTCDIPVKNPQSLWGLKVSKICRNKLIKTNIPEAQEFMSYLEFCKKLSNLIQSRSSSFVINPHSKVAIDIVITNSCIINKKNKK